MDHLKADWHILRKPLGVFIVSALLAAAMLTASNMFWREMRAEYRDHYTRFRDVSTKYLAVDDEERIIAEQYPAFIALYRRGVIGNEHRLSWIETLKVASSDLGLVQAEFTIDPLQPYVPNFGLNVGPFDLSSSLMRLNLGLVHEGDLLRLFGELDRAAEGLYTVEACDMKRLAAGTLTTSGVQANIEANCTLRWFTLDRAGEAEVEL